MRNTKLTICAIGLLLLMGCAQPGSSAPRKITIEATDFAFSPKAITVKVGEPVEIQLKNAGTLEHDFSVMKIEVLGKVMATGSDHGHAGADDPKVHVAAQARASGAVVFTPAEAGEYEVYCSVAGHKEAGMVGKLSVTK